MTPTLLLISAVLMGLAGAMHCISMCGGIAMTLTFGLPAEARQGATLWRWQFLFGAGRVTTYTILGALAGAFGATFSALLPPLAQVPMLISATLMVLLALYLLGHSAGIRLIERLGFGIWRRVKPRLQRLTPVRNARQALAVGMGWGLLPCGLVYSALALAIGAGSSLLGALVMLAFGLVTVTPVAAAGVIGGTAGGIRSRGGRILAAVLALVIAGVLFWQAASGTHHHPPAGGDIAPAGYSDGGHQHHGH